MVRPLAKSPVFLPELMQLLTPSAEMPNSQAHINMKPSFTLQRFQRAQGLRLAGIS